MNTCLNHLSILKKINKEINHLYFDNKNNNSMKVIDLLNRNIDYLDKNKDMCGTELKLNNIQNLFEFHLTILKHYKTQMVVPLDFVQAYNILGSIENFVFYVDDINIKLKQNI